jgi:hypothetical protein
LEGLKVVSYINSSILNVTGEIGQVLVAGTSSMTGSLDLTLFIVFVICLAVCVFFRIPIEFAGVILIPLCLAFIMVASIMWMPVIILALFFAAIITKHFIFR